MSISIDLPDELDEDDQRKLLVNTLRHKYTSYDDCGFTMEDFIQVNGSIGDKYPDLKIESQTQIARKLTAKYSSEAKEFYKAYRALATTLMDFSHMRYRMGIGDIVICETAGVIRFAVVSCTEKDSITVTFRARNGDLYENTFEGLESLSNVVFVSKALKGLDAESSI